METETDTTRTNGTVAQLAQQRTCNASFESSSLSGASNFPPRPSV